MARLWSLILFTLVVLVQYGPLVSGTKYLVTLPNRPHYDSEVVATVTAVGVPPEGDFIQLTYRGAKDTSHKLNVTELQFNKDGVQRWGVIFSWKRMQELEETGVKLEVGNVDKKLYFSQDTGYIFIQTDKPIYSPRQTVRFRIIAVDEYQQLSKYQVKVDIKNPGNVIVDRMRYSAEEAFKGQTFELPREATQGMWTISANFEGLDNTYSETKTVEFEVREYVLPRFSADLTVDTDVITRNTHWVSFFISGKYVYGRPLQGKVELQLGVWDPDNGVKLLPHWYRGELVNGKARANFKMPEVFPLSEEFPKDKRLYVSVNVTEAGTGENHTIVDTSTFLSHPYYVIDFSAADQYFKPGFPYTLKADFKSRSGMPTPWVSLYIVAFFKDKQGNKIASEDFYDKADENARLTKTFELSKDVDKVEIMVGVLDWDRHVFTDDKHYPEKLKTKTNHYIHVSMVKDITEFRDGAVQLLYTTHDVDPEKPTTITLQVLSKGLVVYSTSVTKNTDGRTIEELPVWLFQHVSPSMRVVAYYHATLGGEAEFIVDSLLVDTEDACLEELELYKPGGLFASSLPYKPKEKYELEIEGGKNMRVGLVAVDEAVFILNDKQTLTRESFFQEMANHDQGQGEGDGNDLDTILTNSGLQHVLYDTEAPHTGKVMRLWEILPGADIGGRMKKVAPPFDSSSKFNDRTKNRKAAPPQTVRKYFPESWLFDEIKLDSEGFKALDVNLPDSITTWNFLAVGLSEKMGVCVSKPLKQKVEKLFFADVRLPYKVTRLEEVKVKIAIYNYQRNPIEVNGVVSGVDGICFAANSMRGSSQEGHSFTVTVPAKGIVTEVVKIIPLRNGDLTLTVDLKGGAERDVVERKLYVVAEGLRVHKSITFVLDPEAKHIPHKDLHQQNITFQSSATVNNIFDVNKKEQNTTIDLALPQEVIMGTESCHIAAFGDLMGDIITHAVVQSKSLVDQPMADAEEVLGDLGPTVHALLYINESGLADDELAQKGRRFITHSVVRLLNYKEGAFFRLTPKSKPATWLTAAVLKTLCQASQLTFVDQENLIDQSFSWLAGKVDHQGSGTLEELDWRLSQDSLEYSVMLSAEALIAIMECDRLDEEDHQQLMLDMAFYLEDSVHMIQQPMVLAKAAYALELFDPDVESRSKSAIKRLKSMRRKNKIGQYYWSEKVLEDSDEVPFWYQPGAKASSIEATAYALLVMLEVEENMAFVDGIADWLVGQRNENGAFIGAMDSMAAIQALSRYSLKKRQEELLDIDLLCNVSSERTTGKQTHSFKFTEQDATSPKSINNVPLGQKLEVLTKGQGLGQMHVNVEYNVPIDRNAKCAFNVTVEVKPTIIRWSSDMQSNPMCHACGIGCEDKTTEEKEIKTEEAMKSPPMPQPVPSRKRQTSNSKVTSASRYRPRTSSSSTRRRPKFLHHLPPPPVASRRRSRQSGQSGSKVSRSRRDAAAHQTLERETRSLRNHPVASKRSICIHVCLQYQREGSSGRTSIEVEMLTGFLPIAPDVDRIATHPNVRHAEFIPDRDVLVVQYDKIPSEEKTCFALRAIDAQEVGRPTPASVVIKEAGLPQPSCSLEYNPPPGEESLQVFCADFSNNNRGECRCYSGICSSCLPVPGPRAKIHFGTIKTMTCQSDVAYALNLTKVEDKNQWVEIDATVIHRNKTGSHDIEMGDSIKLITPSSCSCPHFQFPAGTKMDDKMYLLSPDVEKLVDRKGQAVYRYLLDEKSKFLRVSETRADNWSSLKPTVPHTFLQSAFWQQHTC